MLTFNGTVTTLLAATLLSVLDGSQLALPRAATPVIDGTAADAEWKAAWRSTQNAPPSSCFMTAKMFTPPSSHQASLSPPSTSPAATN